jgi:hypothetical protein
VQAKNVLYEWDYGQVSTLPSGQALREFHIGVVDTEIEVARGVFFPTWTYNGRVTGSSLRCVEGDRVRVKLVNAGSYPHSIHFHSIHSARMDGVPGVGISEVQPGEEQELARRRHRLSAEKKQFNEIVMMMNGFDTNFDGENEIYATNSVAFT